MIRKSVEQILSMPCNQVVNLPEKKKDETLMVVQKYQDELILSSSIMRGLLSGGQTGTGPVKNK